MRLFCLPLAAGLAMTPSIRLCLDSPGGKLLGISGGVQRLHGVLPSWSGQESAQPHEYRQSKERCAMSHEKCLYCGSTEIVRNIPVGKTAESGSIGAELQDGHDPDRNRAVPR